MVAPLRIVRMAQPLREGRAQGNGFKQYLERLVKMIPAEVLGLYLIGSGFIPDGKPWALVAWAGVCFAAVIVVRAYGTSDSSASIPPQWASVAISCVAFVIWVYHMGGPFTQFRIHVPWLGSLLVLGWSFFVPYLYKGEIVR